jgi:putative ABC transport system ATP-binding protein
MNDAIIKARELRKTFGRAEALRGASLSIAEGEVVAITGPSGSGKSTLLLCLAGIHHPDGGVVTYSGRRLDQLSETDRTLLRRREFGLVLQFGQLVPELTAAHNVALPLLLEGRGRPAAQNAATEWLGRVGASHVADALPGEMSGGEVQRVAIARALVTGPRVVFADEPTGALDTVGGESVLATLLTVARESRATVVLVTHDNRVAASADREIVLRDGAVEPVTVAS